MSRKHKNKHKNKKKMKKPHTIVTGSYGGYYDDYGVDYWGNDCGFWPIEPVVISPGTSIKKTKKKEKEKEKVVPDFKICPVEPLIDENK